MEREKNHTKKHTLTSLPWYNVLYNPEYARKFHYIPVAIDRRDKLILADNDYQADKNSQDKEFAQSDLTAFIINLAYTSSRVARQSTLKSKFSKAVGLQHLCM